MPPLPVPYLLYCTIAESFLHGLTAAEVQSEMSLKNGVGLIPGGGRHHSTTSGTANWPLS